MWQHNFILVFASSSPASVTIPFMCHFGVRTIVPPTEGDCIRTAIWRWWVEVSVVPYPVWKRDEPTWHRFGDVKMYYVLVELFDSHVCDAFLYCIVGFHFAKQFHITESTEWRKRKEASMGKVDSPINEKKMLLHSFFVGVIRINHRFRTKSYAFMKRGGEMPYHFGLGKVLKPSAKWTWTQINKYLSLVVESQRGEGISIVHNTTKGMIDISLLVQMSFHFRSTIAIPSKLAREKKRWIFHSFCLAALPQFSCSSFHLFTGHRCTAGRICVQIVWFWLMVPFRIGSAFFTRTTPTNVKHHFN